MGARRAPRMCVRSGSCALTAKGRGSPPGACARARPREGEGCRKSSGLCLFGLDFCSCSLVRISISKSVLFWKRLELDSLLYSLLGGLLNGGESGGRAG